ncbi:hypothetical protein BT63DRAFT_482305 [Microthyrium microscopicum]|uniref:Uncharacterized protein n=1 Tax=Microthyrium microscopicum TaxID=703497 RepID=A0A6A6U330_9PEZI|nr:hypothetical protein BT63DRAFT_482305 [Microthyrium microscopicum]
MHQAATPVGNNLSANNSGRPIYTTNREDILIRRTPAEHTLWHATKRHLHTGPVGRRAEEAQREVEYSNDLILDHWRPLARSSKGVRRVLDFWETCIWPASSSHLQNMISRTRATEVVRRRRTTHQQPPAKPSKKDEFFVPAPFSHNEISPDQPQFAQHPCPKFVIHLPERMQQLLRYSRHSMKTGVTREHEETAEYGGRYRQKLGEEFTCYSMETYAYDG